ncbi:autotransporter outer membrane beta-barrel domain-containing protein [Paraburkholderia saeva]|nr:autotransporter outer membrane beta-barrel domain-containing protein [Paraburkholderia saeva]
MNETNPWQVVSDLAMLQQRRARIEPMLPVNALSAVMAIVFPAISNHALAQCVGQILPPSTGCAANVSAGASATGTTINSTGVQTVGSGGFTSATIVNSRGTQSVLAGGNDTGAIVNSGGSQNIAGTASGTTVNAGGKQFVSSGGATTGVSVASGGTQTIMAGASDQLATVQGGGTQLVSGTVTSATVSGKETVSSGGATMGVTVASGGTQTIMTGAGDQLVVIMGGGTQIVSGTATSATLNGGKQSVTAGGVANGTVINSGGSQAVLAGGTANGAVINNGGKQAVSSGGVASAATLNNLGTQIVSGGGVASATVVNSGGVLTVAGGVANGAVINSGGSASVASGGTATNTVVNPFARQTVTSGLAVNTVLVGAVSSGGTQYVSAGGVTLNTTVGQKARQTIYPGGTANSTLVLSAGTQTVSSGGLANGTMVANGGMQQVVGGGTASGSVVTSGGTAALYVGGMTSTGVVPGPVFTSGNVQGTLLVATSTSIVVTGNANATANALVLNGGNVVFSAPDSAGYKALTVNGLSGSGQFSLNTNVAAGQGDQLIVNNGSGNYVLSVQDASTTPAPKGTRMALVSGTNDNANFTLQSGTIDVGAEKYALQDVAGQFYLADTGQLGDAASVAQALPAVSTMLWYEQIQQTMSRMAELRGGTDQGLWIHAYGQRFTLDSAGISSSVDAGGVQFGRDLRFARPYGDWYVGLTGGVAEARTTTGDSGSASVYPWNVGLYGGLAGKNGWFTDAVVRFISTSNTLSITGNNTGSYNDNGFAASLEGGKRLELAGDWIIEPRVAFSYLSANSIGYTLANGMPIQLAAHNTALGSAGVTVSKTLTLWQTPMQPFVSLNAVHAFNSQQTVTVAGSDINAQTPDSWGSVSAGVAASLNRSSHFYVDVSYAKGQHYQSPIAVNVGLSYQK